MENKDDQSLEEFLAQFAENDEISEPKNLTGDDLLAIYMDELRDVPALTPGEEEQLLSSLAHGSGEAREKARDRLIEGKLGRALEIAGEYRNKGLHMNDLIQEASIGLLVIADGYTGGDFDAAMEKAVRDGIEAALADQSREKTIAEDMRARVNVLKDISASMAKELGREPSVRELAERMKMPEDEIRGIMKEMLNAMSVKSEEMHDAGIDVQAFTDSNPLSKDYPEEPKRSYPDNGKAD